MARTRTLAPAGPARRPKTSPRTWGTRGLLESLESRTLLSTYYVDPAGSDAAAGSTAAPWKTLQKAANSVVAGDAVVVRPGNYAGFNLARSGSGESARITFSAQSGAVIDTPVNIGNSYGINASGQSFLTIEGFTFRPQASQGEWYSAIRLGGTPGNWVRGNVVRNNTAAMRVVGRDATPDKYGLYASWQDGILFENNTASGGYNTGIYVANSSRNYAVRANHVFDVGGNGIHNNGDLSSGSPGVNSNAVIEGNVIHNVGFGIGGQAISCDGLQDSVLRNNLIYDAHAKGISLYVTNAADGSKRNTLVNNTVITAADSTGAALRIPGGSTGNTMFNNIFLSARSSVSGDGGYSYSDEAGGNFYDYNLVTDAVQRQISLASWRGQGRDVHGRAAAIGAASLGSIFAGDYRLKSGSAAIDLGAGAFNGKTAPAVDVAGAARPQGAGWDAGAYEFASTAPPADTVAPTATGSASNVTTGGGTTHTFTVGYTDNVALDATTFDSSDVRVTGPGGFNQLAAFVSAAGSGGSRTVTYRLTAPGGAWDDADNGTYTLSIESGQVRDTSANAVPAGAVGTFSVSVPPADTTAPSVTSRSPGSGATDVAAATNVTATFNEAIQAATVSFFLRDPSGNAVSAAVAYNASTRTATLDPAAELADSTTYTATISGAQDAAGNTMAPVNWSFTTAADPAPTPSAPAAPSELTASATGPTRVELRWVDNSGDETSFRIDRRVAGGSFAPLVTLAADATSYVDTGVSEQTSYEYRVSALNAAGESAPSNAAGVTTPATPPAPTTPLSLWDGSARPANASASDRLAVELGVRFRADVDGYITGIRFYKGPSNTGTHTGSLWSANGTRLASVTFTNETASGWQQANFDSPVFIRAGTTYVASYFAPRGGYSYDYNYFTTSYRNGPLRALSNGGVFRYGSAGGFPTSTHRASNYWVDVLFTTAAPAATATPAPAVFATSSGGPEILSAEGAGEGHVWEDRM